MILVGNPVISPGREQLLARGGITILVDDDVCRRIWLATDDGRDFQATEVVASNGDVFLCGRIRYDSTGSPDPWAKDHKDTFRFAIEKVYAEDPRAADLGDMVRNLARDFGFANLDEHEVNGGIHDVIAVLRREGARLGIRSSFVTPEDLTPPENANPEAN